MNLKTAVFAHFGKKDLYSVVLLKPHNTFLRSVIMFMLYEAFTF